jgi:hypothetical protein
VPKDVVASQLTWWFGWNGGSVGMVGNKKGPDIAVRPIKLIEDRRAN